jgi:predicted DNA-binding transcriptional regulator YafY
MEDKFKILQETIGTGEIIKIRYHGGSHPGTVREILPMKIDDKYLKTYCMTTKELRTFKIDKIEIASANEEVNYKI